MGLGFDSLYSLECSLFFINITILCSNEEHIASRVQIAC